MNKLFLVLLFCLVFSPLIGAQTTIFEFSTPFTDSANSWSIYTDGSMGGVSSADFWIDESSTARFKGLLSLANNGGIAQVISPYIPDNLTKYEGISLRFKGDGTPFIISLQNTAIPSKAKHLEYVLYTEAGVWTEAQIPFSQFKNNYFGVPIIKNLLTLNDAHHLAFINANQEGVFLLEIDNVKLF